MGANNETLRESPKYGQKGKKTWQPRQFRQRHSSPRRDNKHQRGGLIHREIVNKLHLLLGDSMVVVMHNRPYILLTDPDVKQQEGQQAMRVSIHRHAERHCVEGGHGEAEED